MIKRWWKESLLIVALMVALSYAIKGKTYNVPTQSEEKENKEVSSSISFNQAFKNAYNENGEGSLFNWNGNQYKVVFKEDK